MNIKILEDPDTDMYKIYKDDTLIFLGNFWDVDIIQILKQIDPNMIIQKFKYE